MAKKPISQGTECFKRKHRPTGSPVLLLRGAGSRASGARWELGEPGWPRLSAMACPALPCPEGTPLLPSVKSLGNSQLCQFTAANYVQPTHLSAGVGLWPLTGREQSPLTELLGHRCCEEAAQSQGSNCGDSYQSMGFH